MTLTVEVWSDVMCPFCYLGKHRFAKALADFGNPDDVTVRWRSFQLNPSLSSDSPISANDYLSHVKGIDIGQAAAMNDRLARVGREEGLVYNFDQALVTNTFDAHRLIQFAGAHAKQDAVVDLLFAAYFTDGEDVGQLSVLVDLARSAGLEPEETRAMLATDAYANVVRSDITTAAQLGIDGVPFFVFDRKYAVAGAQDVAVFRSALDQSLV